MALDKGGAYAANLTRTALETSVATAPWPPGAPSSAGRVEAGDSSYQQKPTEILPSSLCSGSGAPWVRLHAVAREEGCAGRRTLISLLTTMTEEPG